ncbi:MAG: hypothetical protein Q4G67_01800 [Actinomycetia bacterium]|nr:hypothetical protein [Actinomycetes bacterium]
MSGRDIIDLSTWSVRREEDDSRLHSGGSGYGEPDWADVDWGEPAYGPDLGVMTRITVIDDEVVDVTRLPISGTDFECAALELGRGKGARVTRQEEWRPAEPAIPPHERQLAWLARIVGGVQALDGLDSEPLIDDRDQAPAVEEDLLSRAGRVLEVAVRVGEDLVSPELAIAAARIARSAFASVPGLLRHDSTDETIAGSVLWCALKANDLLGPSRLMPATEVQRALNLPKPLGNAGRTFATAVAGGADPHDGVGWSYTRTDPDVVALGDPGFLVARFRQRLIMLRDIARAVRLDPERHP